MAYLEYEISEGEVPPKLMARAKALLPDSRSHRSQIYEDKAGDWYELEVRNASGGRAMYDVYADGREKTIRRFMKRDELPPAVAAEIEKRVPGATLEKALRKQVPGAPDEIIVTLTRGVSVHTFRFDPTYQVVRHQVRMPALVEIDMLGAEGKSAR